VAPEAGGAAPAAASPGAAAAGALPSCSSTVLTSWAEAAGGISPAVMLGEAGAAAAGLALRSAAGVAVPVVMSVASMAE